MSPLSGSSESASTPLLFQRPPVSGRGNVCSSSLPFSPRKPTFPPFFLAKPTSPAIRERTAAPGDQEHVAVVPWPISLSKPWPQLLSTGAVEIRWCLEARGRLNSGKWASFSRSRDEEGAFKKTKKKRTVLRRYMVVLVLSVERVFQWQVNLFWGA